MKSFHANPDSFASVLAEASLLQDEVTINLEPGTYLGPIVIQKSHLTLIGSSPETTFLTYALAANECIEDDERRGTFRTQTVFVDADHVTFQNITIENTAGPGEIADQAIALYSDGDYLSYINCHFKGHQDTLFTAPLPPKEVIPGGFKGPKQFAPRRSGRQHFKNCYIEGTVDFIFGGAVCFFENCEIYSIARPEDGKGYTTAGSQPEGQTYGYVFFDCHFTGSAKKHSVYLGRPWREYAHVVVLNSYLGDHIHPNHWHDWNKEAAHETVKFYEYGNYGPGASSQLPDYARVLKEEELDFYSFERVFSQI